MGATPTTTRLFAATFIAVALMGLVTQIATWRSAYATQSAMVILAQRLDRMHEPAAAELAAEAGDDAVQAALASSVLFAAMLTVLGLGFWYNRRRLAAPFSRISQALQRVGEGQFVEPLPEDQPGEFGVIARGVNHMAKALAWREELQAYLSQLLAALNTSADESATGLSRPSASLRERPRRRGVCCTSRPMTRMSGRRPRHAAWNRVPTRSPVGRCEISLATPHRRSIITGKPCSRYGISSG